MSKYRFCLTVSVLHRTNQLKYLKPAVKLPRSALHDQLLKRFKQIKAKLLNISIQFMELPRHELPLSIVLFERRLLLQQLVQLDY